MQPRHQEWSFLAFLKSVLRMEQLLIAPYLLGANLLGHAHYWPSVYRGLAGCVHEEGEQSSIHTPAGPAAECRTSLKRQQARWRMWPQWSKCSNILKEARNLDFHYPCTSLHPPEMFPFNSASCEHYFLLSLDLPFLCILKYLLVLLQDTETKTESRRYQTTHHLSGKKFSQSLLTEYLSAWQHNVCHFIYLLLQEGTSLPSIPIRGAQESETDYFYSIES